MPPRFQCLNALRKATPARVPALKPAFSTSRKVLADDLPINAKSKFIDPLIPEKVVTDGTSKYQRSVDATAAVTRLISNAQQSRSSRTTTPEAIEQHALAADLTKQIHRRWRAGDIYAPHDLSAQEMMKWKQRGRVEHDVFDVLGLDPMAQYKNFSIISEYMTPMGRIKHSRETGLRPVNQRKIARAIRRTIGIGMMPSVHRHPEILRAMAQGTVSG